MNIIEIKDYNPQWKNRFKRLKDQIEAAVSGHVKEIIHIGSTSIEGMAAKPIIDIDLVVESFNDFEKIKTAMRTIGYEHEGDLGVSDRESFRFKREPEIAHNLYIILEGSIAHRNHLLLKKHLEENRVDHQRYKNLKMKLSKKAKSKDDYCKKKTELILELLQAQGMSSDEIDLIRSQNL